MIVPDYWAEARRQHRAGGRQMTVRRFGWSEASEADALAMAEDRAGEALRRILAGEKLERREPKVAYNGAEGVPIREEVLERREGLVITRNAYGAQCLNAEKALFADVDFAPRANPLATRVAFAVLLLVSAAAGVILGKWLFGVMFVFLSLVSAPLFGRAITAAFVAARGGAEALARARLATFLAGHADWSVRVYRTPSGLRLLATHRPYGATDDVVREFFDAVSADPVYVRMCLNQHCFRARLTAKPWRIGIDAHLRPRPGVWPVRPEHLPRRQAWVTEYERKAAGFAACRFVETVGSGAMHMALRPVVALHDERTRALQPGAPLA